MPCASVWPWRVASSSWFEYWFIIVLFFLRVHVFEMSKKRKNKTKKNTMDGQRWFYRTRLPTGRVQNVFKYIFSNIKHSVLILKYLIPLWKINKLLIRKCFKMFLLLLPPIFLLSSPTTSFILLPPPFKTYCNLITHFSY